MVKYARLVDNRVWEIFIPPVGTYIEDCFVPEIVSQFIECPEEVEQNWEFDGINWIAPEIIPAKEEVVSE